eukprot:Mrub_01871.p1 GENE.Mrub_01871~~Mrub_01871.p1  ORF type:complete len:643 (-),score=74.14 Mrub_01871:10-1938(-)
MPKYCIKYGNFGFDNLHLPQDMANYFDSKGIINLFDWQRECLSLPDLLTFKPTNLLYSAPTSGGKTLVSELIMIHRQTQQPQRKVLFALPFISIVSEKLRDLKAKLNLTDISEENYYKYDSNYIKVGAFTSNHNYVKLEDIDIAICTIEKCNSIINKLIMNNELDLISTIVVDELHLISDEHRGYIIENMLSKILYLCDKRKYNIQIIAMSATLPNLEDIAYWMKAQLYVTDFRPVTLMSYLVEGDCVYDAEKNPIRKISYDNLTGTFYNPMSNEKAKNLLSLIFENYAINKSTIIFCKSKNECKNVAIKVTKILEHNSKKIFDKYGIYPLSNDIWNVDDKSDLDLKWCVKHRTAWHHSGLSMEERTLIEEQFTNSNIRILCATSTLAAGVNLPVKRVIINDIKVGLEDMKVSDYKQMSGRAGRFGYEPEGECFLICPKQNLKTAFNLMTGVYPKLESAFHPSKRGIQRFLLECISGDVVDNSNDFNDLCQYTLFAKMHSYELDNAINLAVEYLIKEEFVEKVSFNKVAYYYSNWLGDCELNSGLPPADCKTYVNELLYYSKYGIQLTDYMMIYLCTPLVQYRINWDKYASIVALIIKKTHPLNDLFSKLGFQEKYVITFCSNVSANRNHPDKNDYVVDNYC